MESGLPDLDSMLPQAQADALLYAQHVILHPRGITGLIMRVLLSAPDEEFRPIAVARRAHVDPRVLNPAIECLKKLGFITVRLDREAPRVGGYPPRWLQITESGYAAAVREGLTAAPSR